MLLSMSRWRTALLVLVIVAAVLPWVGSRPAAAATGSTVVGVASGRCLDVIGNGRTARTGVNIYDCIGQENQAWTYTAAGELRVYDSMCLDVAGQDTTAPARVQIYGCNGGANQRWQINANGTITGVQSGLCLDVTGQQRANSTVVGMWTCNRQTNQKWTTSFAGRDSQAPTVPGNPRVSNLACDTQSPTAPANLAGSAPERR